MVLPYPSSFRLTTIMCAASLCELYPYLEETGLIEHFVPKKGNMTVAKWCAQLRHTLARCVMCAAVSEGSASPCTRIEVSQICIIVRRHFVGTSACQQAHACMIQSDACGTRSGCMSVCAGQLGNFYQCVMCAVPPVRWRAIFCSCAHLVHGTHAHAAVKDTYSCCCKMGSPSSSPRETGPGVQCCD